MSEMEKSAYQRGWEDGVWTAMNIVEMEGFEAGLALINKPPPIDPKEYPPPTPSADKQ